MIFVISISFTNEDALLQEGYKFIPAVFSTEAYSYIFKDGGNLINSYVISFLVTIVGTAISLAFMSTYAYVLPGRSGAFLSGYDPVPAFARLLLGARFAVAGQLL